MLRQWAGALRRSVRQRVEGADEMRRPRDPTETEARREKFGEGVQPARDREYSGETW